MPVSKRTIQTRKRRDELHRMLGGVCQLCGSSDHLELHYRPGGGRSHHGLGWRARLSFYKAKARLGEVQLLCASDHRRIRELFPKTKGLGTLGPPPL